MTQPAPLPYMGAPAQAQWSTDLSHLKTLAICHYIWGGLIMLISCLGLIHVFLGLSMLGGREPMAGWLFLGAGVLIIAVGWTIGILNILSGRGMEQRRYRVLSFIMAGLNCTSFPLGTLLGVFTFVVLCRDSVKQLYQAEQAARTGTPTIPVASQAG